MRKTQKQQEKEIFTRQNGVGTIVVQSTKLEMTAQRVHRYEISFEISSILSHAAFSLEKILPIYKKTQVFKTIIFFFNSSEIRNRQENIKVQPLLPCQIDSKLPFSFLQDGYWLFHSGTPPSARSKMNLVLVLSKKKIFFPSPYLSMRFSAKKKFFFSSSFAVILF